ncbi:thioesterase family protein [Desulfococcaceae bacterium OttesenSCG-928-F15]|nr:thioesterase family protein [Desulfococcaceae bacterium OttesenSCG-928-F15]
MYTKTFTIRWHELDANAHMKNTAYLNRAADVRLAFFAEHGFSPADFANMKFGPMALKDEIEYYKEIGLMQELTVSFVLKSINADGSRYQIQNEYFRADGKLCAKITTYGAWLNLVTRKIMAPPESLYKALLLLPKTDDFAVLP